MADHVKAIEKFRHWAEAAAEEATKSGGLVPRFHTCVNNLCEEMKGRDVDDILLAYDAAMEEVEAAAKAKIEEHFGKGATLTSAMPSFKVIKSTYRAFLKGTFGVMDAEKYSTYYAVQKEVSRHNKAKKDAMKGVNGGSKPDLDGLPESVATLLSEGLRALRELPVEKQAEVAKGFRNRAFAEQRKGKPKTAADAAGGSGQTAAAA